MFFRVAALIALLTLAGCDGDDALAVSEARVRAPIPGQDKTVGYFTAHNPSDEAVKLTGAESAAVRAIEIHTTSRDGDVVRMRRLDEVVIPAGDTVRFEPGGRHLMLFGVAELGENVEITLRTADGQRLPVRFETVPLGADR